MAVHREVYKGRKISVSTEERKKGQFTWSYTIDANIYERCRDRPIEYEEMMLREGLHHAKLRVDAMSASFEYKGHQVEIVTDSDEDGQWAWSYTIDSGKLALSEVAPSRSKATAIDAAKDHARRYIDANY